MPFSAPVTVPEIPLIERIDQQYVGTCRVITMDVPVESVVSFRGSLVAAPDIGAGDELLQDLTVMLLDKGTTRRDRFQIAEVLDRGGSQLRFGSEGIRIRFSGRALRSHVEAVLRLTAEQLREPAFDEAEFEKARAQLAASLKRSLENTGAQAAGALSRRIYSTDHPNYAWSPEEDLARLATYTPEHVRTYHRTRFGARNLVLLAVGDLDREALARAVAEDFGEWPVQSAEPQYGSGTAASEPGRTTVPLPDKSNVDVRMGNAVGVLRRDPDYLPLYIGMYVLGGNFSARLMATVRDEMGLTYGIHANLSGINARYNGQWNVGVTLSTENVDRGIEATLDQVRRFVEDGITETELAEKKTTLTGSFKVGLSTTGGLAGSLLNSVEQELGVDYLDRFSAEVEAVTLEQVNGAIRRHVHPDQMHMALAGTLQ